MGNRNSQLSAEELATLTKETKFDENELKLWHKSFLQECPGGKLYLEDFKEIYKQFFPQGNSAIFAKFIFETLCNNDNAIEFKDFIKTLNITSRGTLDEKLTWAFKLYDVQKNNFIKEDDMLNIIKAIFAMVGNSVKLSEEDITAESRAKKIFQQMDKNKSGQITLNDFLEASKEDPSIKQALTMYEDLETN